jgi:hypothetical protein
MDQSDRGNQQIGIFNQLSACPKLSIELSRPIQYRVINHYNTQHPPQALEGDELPVCANGQEPSFRLIIAHRIQSHRVPRELGLLDTLPDARLLLEMCCHDVRI